MVQRLLSLLPLGLSVLLGTPRNRLGSSSTGSAALNDPDRNDRDRTDDHNRSGYDGYDHTRAQLLLFGSKLCDIAGLGCLTYRAATGLNALRLGGGSGGHRPITKGVGDGSRCAAAVAGVVASVVVNVCLGRDLAVRQAAKGTNCLVLTGSRPPV